MYFSPTINIEKYISKLSNKLNNNELELVYERVNYYNKLQKEGELINFTSIKNLRNPISPKAYYFDTYEFARYFNKNLKLDYVFGDVNFLLPSPSIVKSRPISNKNENSILLNLDKVRHFIFIENDKIFSEKKPKLIGRFAVYQEHRKLFFEKYFHNPNCNLGQVNKIGGNEKWIKPKISLKEHLDYQFVLSLEGNDVATNLKWIMSSNSIAVMPKPKYETWFMEGQLIGGKHYIEINEDFSDLDEKLDYYKKHSELCENIIINAHNHIKKFQNSEIEKLCSILVLKKYFKINNNLC